MRDNELDRLLRNAPPRARLSREKREAIWAELDAHLTCPAQRSPWRKTLRAGLVAAAAALLIMASSVMLSRKPLTETPGIEALNNAAPFGHVEALNGQCRSAGGAGLKLGDEVKVGDQLEVGPRGGLKLALTDGTTLLLCENTRIACAGPRAKGAPTLRLLTGEVRASVTPGPPETPFSIETPEATLKVLGTRFNCKLYQAAAESAAGQPAEEEQTMRQLRAALRSALLLTVLSGAVEVSANDVVQTVTAGSRAVVAAEASAAGPEKLGQSEYTDKWLGEPTHATASKELMFEPIEDNLLYGMFVVDVQTGKNERVADFVGCAPPTIIAQLGPELALLKIPPLIFPHFGTNPVGDHGRPFIEDRLMLINVATGEKLAVPPLADYDPLYLTLSPDNRKLAFVGSKILKGAPAAQREPGLYVLDLETLEVKRLLKGDFKTQPNWSPDSRWLTFATAQGYISDESQYKIVLVDTITANVVETGLTGAGVHFMPDNERILYSAGFKRGGSWSAGVPSWGNLFLAKLPNGKPQQITSLPQGGAINPSISPDGSRIIYWEASQSAEGILHTLDLATGTDAVVDKANAFSRITWLDDSSQILLSPPGWSNESKTIKRINLADVAVQTFTPEPAPFADDVREAQRASAERILEPFRMYRNAVDAQDFHRVDEAVALYRDARDKLAQVVATLEKDGALPGLMITPDDIRPYAKVFADEAALDSTARSVRIVRDNLDFYIKCLFDNNYREKHSIPTDLQAFFQEQLQKTWQTNHICSQDTDRARMLFLVPGDDPAKVTSYEMTAAGPDAHTLTLRTPVLANGKRLEATYTLNKRDMFDATIIETQ